MAAKSRGSLFATPSGEFSKATTGGLWVPERIAEAGTNLARAYEAAPEQAHEWGRQFYPEWQQTAAHIRPALSHTPTNGWPPMIMPPAKIKPCTGGYMEA